MEGTEDRDYKSLKRPRLGGKPLKPIENMYVEVHSVLAKQWYMADLERELENVGAHLSVTENLYDEQLIMWSTWKDEISSECDIKKALYILTAEMLSTNIEDGSLGFLLGQTKELTNCDITLIVFGVKEYLKNKQTQLDEAFMSEPKLLSAITDLLVKNDIDVMCVNSANELALTIVHMTKAVADASSKEERNEVDNKASFYMRGDNKNCVAVDEHGNGLTNAWQQMLAILPASSLEISRAIVNTYNRPIELYESFQESDGEQKLSELGVSRAAVPGAKPRKLGPAFAKKLRMLFTANDGNVLLE